MAKHSVKITIPVRQIGYADIEFDVYRNKAKIGQLNVSQGSIAWIPRDKQLARKLSWKTFASLMAAAGTRSRVRKSK